MPHDVIEPPTDLVQAAWRLAMQCFSVSDDCDRMAQRLEDLGNEALGLWDALGGPSQMEDTREEAGIDWRARLAALEQENATLKANLAMARWPVTGRKDQ